MYKIVSKRREYKLTINGQDKGVLYYERSPGRWTWWISARGAEHPVNTRRSWRHESFPRHWTKERTAQHISRLCNCGDNAWTLKYGEPK